MTVALVAASAALAGGTLANTAIASAESREWDIERYDDCMSGFPSSDPSEKLAWTRKCCLDSGGVWNDAMGKCQSPPADAVSQPTRPGVAPSPVVATQNPAPPPPPFRNPGVVPTFTLSPIGWG